MAGRASADRLLQGDDSPKRVITLAADFAEGVTKTKPYELSQHDRWSKWGLPRSGGLNAQSLTKFVRAETAHYVYTAFKSRADAAKAKKIMDWAEANPQMARFCRDVDEMR
jgi:hypothetical protein